MRKLLFIVNFLLISNLNAAEERFITNFTLVNTVVEIELQRFQPNTAIELIEELEVKYLQDEHRFVKVRFVCRSSGLNILSLNTAHLLVTDNSNYKTIGAPFTFKQEFDGTDECLDFVHKSYDSEKYSTEISLDWTLKKFGHQLKEK